MKYLNKWALVVTLWWSSGQSASLILQYRSSNTAEAYSFSVKCGLKRENNQKAHFKNNFVGIDI